MQLERNLLMIVKAVVALVIFLVVAHTLHTILDFTAINDALTTVKN